MKHQLGRLLSFAAALFLVTAAAGQTAWAEGGHKGLSDAATQAIAHAITSSARRPNPAHSPASVQLYTFDPGLTGTVSCNYVGKFGRMAALFVQPHSFPNTACGLLYNGLIGLPLGDGTFDIHLDISDDTKITNKLVYVLVGVDSLGNVITHTTNGDMADFSNPSGPGWTTYGFSAATFSPTIGATEVLSGLALVVSGGTTDHPDHADHWSSRPAIDGVFLQQPLTGSVSLNAAP